MIDIIVYSVLKPWYNTHTYKYIIWLWSKQRLCSIYWGIWEMDPPIGLYKIGLYYIICGGISVLQKYRIILSKLQYYNYLLLM